MTAGDAQSRPRRVTPPTKEQAEQAKDRDREQHRRETLNALIGEQVLHALGEPGDLHRAQVRPLWEGHYRVNVLRRVDAVSFKIVHSYFLVADGDGNIVASTPGITRR